ncbi:MAG TPA: hypothetical protein VN903_06720, partial [Polyangia bacterium]|nr:hypothetical protein [Polyangia bacterium]
MRAKRAAATLLALGALSGVVVGNGSSLPGDAVTVGGNLVLVHSDDFATGRSTSRYALQTNSGLTNLRFQNLSAMPGLGRAVVSG